MQDRRRYPRVRVLKDAKIVIGTSSVVDCTVRDLNSTGARIEVQDAIDLPEALDITFDGGLIFQSCFLKWRKLNQIGVEFFDVDTPLLAA